MTGEYVNEVSSNPISVSTQSDLDKKIEIIQVLEEWIMTFKAIFYLIVL